MELYIKNIGLALCLLGCIAGVGKLLVVPILLLLFLLYKYNSIRVEYILFLKRNIYSICFMFLFILLMFLSNLLLFNYKGIKETMHYFERMLPFFCIVPFLINNKKRYTIFFLSLIFGLVVSSFSYLYNGLILGLPRANGDLGSVNIYGGTIVLLLPFISAFIFYFRKNIYLKSIGIFTFVYMLFILFMIQSRGAILGLICSFIILLIILNAINILKTKYFIYIVLVIILICTLGYNIFYDNIHRSHDYIRPELVRIAWEIFSDYKITGIGFGNFTSMYVTESFVSPLSKEFYHAHNTYMKYLSETGLMGFTGFLLVIINLLKQSYIYTYNCFKYGTVNLFSIAILTSIVGMMVHGYFDVCFSARYYAMLFWLLVGFTFFESSRIHSDIK